MESLIWVDVYVFIDCVSRKHIVMEITFVVNMTFGPALLSKASHRPMNKDIFFRGLLVEMNEASWNVPSCLSLIVIIVFVFSSLIEANSMSTLVCERCLLTRIREQPSYIEIIDP